MPIDAWKLVQDLAPWIVMGIVGWVFRLARRLRAEREANRRMQAGMVALVERVRILADLVRIALYLHEGRIQLTADRKEQLRLKASQLTDDLHEAQGKWPLRRSNDTITLALGKEETAALRSLLKKGPA